MSHSYTFLRIVIQNDRKVYKRMVTDVSRHMPLNVQYCPPVNSTCVNIHILSTQSQVLTYCGR